MIKITVFRGHSGKTQGLLITGHSGSADYGSDIICAGVSALAQSALLSLTDYLKVKTTFKIKSGYLKFTLQDVPTELTEAAFSVALIGFSEIQKSNPKYVNIHTVGGELDV